MNAVDVHLLRARQALHNADAIVPALDADGLAAGAMALRARDEDADAAILLARGQTPFSPGAPLPDGPLAILGWGVRELDRPAVFVDHHIPEAAPREDQVVISSYGEHPPVPTAPLLRRAMPDMPAWLAAVGAAADLGSPGLALPECEGAPRAAVRQLCGLVDAPRRCPDGPVGTALALLVEHEEPADALLDPRIAELEEAKRAWKAELDRTLRAQPRIGDVVAFVRCSSPYEVHPDLAANWARRLAPRVVIVANDGYLDGRVSFAVRGGSFSLPALVRAVLPDGAGELAHGNDRVAGGTVTPEGLGRMLAALGLPGA